jgi:hypothetical protein
MITSSFFMGRLLFRNREMQVTLCPTGNELPHCRHKPYDTLSAFSEGRNRLLLQNTAFCFFRTSAQGERSGENWNRISKVGIRISLE